MSTNAFAKAVGLKRSENLYQIKRGSFGISKELARLITLKYPTVNRSWLLTGEGSMLTDTSSKASADELISAAAGAIPYYQADVTSLSNSTEKPMYHIVLPMFKGATLAATCSGGAMQPSIASGSIAILREIPVASILPGEIYMVVTNDFVVLRRIRTVEGGDDSVLLVADNNRQFDDMTISKKAINRLFLVVGVISNNQM